MTELQFRRHSYDLISKINTDFPRTTDQVYLNVVPKHTKKKINPNRIFNRSLDLSFGLVFLFPAIGVIGFLYILHKIYNRTNGPFLYKGYRIGKNKNIFEIYKIRTLKSGSELQVAHSVLNPGSDLEIKFGRFLRNTRLDELPQIFNIIKGDLSLIGPRPVRVEIYEKYYNTIPNYELRFMVKPGLIGYSQLITPHNSPKRMRSLINYKYVKTKTNPLNVISILGLAMVHIPKNFYRELFNKLNDAFNNCKHRGVLSDRRKVRRIKNKKVHFSFADIDLGKISDHNFKMLDINYNTLCLISNIDFNPGNEIQFVLKTKKYKSNNIKQAKCRVLHIKKSKDNLSNGFKWRYVIFYEPISELNRYIVDQYILKQSIYS